MAFPVATERDWMQAVLDAARYLGWTCFHAFDARRSEPGWPDIVCVREGGPILAWECKTARGRTTPAQERWLEVLGSVPGVDARVIRPDDWEAVVRALRGEAA